MHKKPDKFKTQVLLYKLKLDSSRNNLTLNM